ncbi:MAG: transaldolase family protein [Planctomycetota bacterium]|jgi:transaldolase|nr:transaldolase family protein [Planctomycetota bacterium]
MGNYFDWLAEKTPTRWWHDSAIPEEILAAGKLGALGVTTNPVLTFKSFQAAPDFWKDKVAAIPQTLGFEERAEALLRLVATFASEQFKDVFARTGGRQGLALGQLNPSRAGDAEGMLAQARRYHAWAPNIAIKLPATRSGVEVVESLAEEGIPICATINVSVAQALSVGEAYEKGAKRAEAAGRTPPLCLVVQQVGRLDDYLRDVARDTKSAVREEDVILAGLAMAKRTYQIFQERKYRSIIMPAGLRGPYHVTELAGGVLTFSIHPRVQKMILESDPAREAKVDLPVDKGALERLLTLREFRRAYEPDGLKPDEYLAFGVVQKLLSQFTETGWAPLETYGSDKVSSRWT